MKFEASCVSHHVVVSACRFQAGQPLLFQTMAGIGEKASRLKVSFCSKPGVKQATPEVRGNL